MNNESAHRLVKATLKLSDDYNEHGFINESPGLLKAWQVTLQDSLALHKYLHTKEPCKATYMSMLYITQMLLRLSHLIHNGTIESNKDKFDSTQRFFKKYGRQLH